MSLPETIRVKISSEGAESIGITPVVLQDMPTEELMRLILALTGKAADRIREILLRGSLVSGGSRFRWQGVDAPVEHIIEHLRRYPDPDPFRAFAPERCFQAVIRSRSKSIVLEREAGQKRRMFRKSSFWDELMAATSAPEYVEYSYREQADVFRFRPDAQTHARIVAAAPLLAYSSFETHLRTSTITSIEFYVRR